MRHPGRAIVGRDIPMVQIMGEPILMAGGLDIMVPPFRAKPGTLRAAKNFECSLFGGYRRIAGYERFDGHAKPSDGIYYMIPVTSVTGGAVGNTLHGATSGASGKIIAITATHFIFTQLTLVFQAENLNVGAGTIAVSTGTQSAESASTPKLHAQYKNLAADVYRALISAVPGSGAVRGVNLYNDVLYAFRDNAGGTAACMYKSAASGWSLCALGIELDFITGTTEIAEGVTVTGGTSGFSGVVKRVRLESGTWAGGTAAGGLIFATTTGTFQNGENLRVGGATYAVADSASAAITLLPGGRYEFVNANFTGSTDTKRMYGCDGKNRAFEWDGTVWVPINTGMVSDAPTHIAAHLYHLFLSFYGSVQFSTSGFPYKWTPVTGAGEIAMGANVTGFAVQAADITAAALAVFTDERIAILYGTGAPNFNLLPFRDNVGAYAHSIQNMSHTYFLDAQGIANLEAVQQYGNFQSTAVANQIKALLNTMRTTVNASCISRDLGQYRFFCTSKSAIYMTLVANKVVGVMPIEFEHVVRCIVSGQFNDATEGIFFGSDDGWVYQMEKGTSFDGEDIEAYFDLAYCFSGSFRTTKNYHDAVLEMQGPGYVEFFAGYALGYSSTDYIQADARTLLTRFQQTNWDGFTWDTFAWDGVTLGPSVLEVDGEAENVSIGIRCVGDEFMPFTVTGGMIHYTPRREIR